MIPPGTATAADSGASSITPLPCLNNTAGVANAAYTIIADTMSAVEFPVPDEQLSERARQLLHVAFPVFHDFSENDVGLIGRISRSVTQRLEQELRIDLTTKRTLIQHEVRATVRA